MLRTNFKIFTIMWLNSSMDCSEKGFCWRQRGVGENRPCPSNSHLLPGLPPPPACPQNRRAFNNKRAFLTSHHVLPALNADHNFQWLPVALGKYSNLFPDLRGPAFSCPTDSSRSPLPRTPSPPPYFPDPAHPLALSPTSSRNSPYLPAHTVPPLVCSAHRVSLKIAGACFRAQAPEEQGL